MSNKPKLRPVADKPARVYAAIISNENVKTLTFTSWIRFLMHDAQGPGHVMKHGQVYVQLGGPLLAQARNTIVKSFLETNCEWLWFVDSDMTFDADSLDRLLATADPEKRPIVGGLCFAYDQVTGRTFPTMKVLRDGTVVDHLEWNDGEVVPVVTTGAAFLLIHRSALRTIGADNPGAYPWFAEADLLGEPMGEDSVFCLRAANLGIPVHVDTRVKTGHIKTLVVTEVTYEAWRNQTKEIAA